MVRSPIPNFCVIKQLFPRHPGTDPQKAIELFRQEAARLALLGQHPQIPQLLAHFEFADAQYLVQQYIEGQNLDEVLNQDGPLGELQIRDLLADLLPVLRFIHSYQVIHRDIKPENIIRPYGGDQHNRDHLVLVDFGASKYATQNAVAKTGTVIGSAGYVAPEQAMGKAEFASDLYSLGITCIHLLTGLHPFDLYSVSEDAWVWQQYLPRPISGRLRRILDKLLQKATSQRYRNATEVLQDLGLESKSGSSNINTVNTSNSGSISTSNAASKLSAASRSSTVSSSPKSSSSSATSSVRARSPQRSPSSSQSSQVEEPWRSVRTLTGHEGGVTAVAISPGGRILASGSSDKSIKFWSLETGELLHTFPGRSLWMGDGHTGRISTLVFSPDGDTLASGSDDGTVKWWDLTHRELIYTFPNHGWGISAIAFSPDAYLLACGSAEGLIQLWDLDTEEVLGNLSAHQDTVSALVFEPDGQTLISSSYDKSIRFWDLSTGNVVNTLMGHLDRVSALALSPDRRTLISGSWDKTLKFWDLEFEQQRKVISAHRKPITCLAMHPSGRFFASGSEDSTIKLWNVETGDRLCTLRSFWGINALTFSPNGELLVSGSGDELIKIWRRR